MMNGREDAVEGLRIVWPGAYSSVTAKLAINFSLVGESRAIDDICARKGSHPFGLAKVLASTLFMAANIFRRRFRSVEGEMACAWTSGVSRQHQVSHGKFWPLISQ